MRDDAGALDDEIVISGELLDLFFFSLDEVVGGGGAVFF